MSSDESSNSEMPYDSSDEEVREEEEVSGDDDSDGGPGFSSFRSNSTALPPCFDLWVSFLSPKPKPVCFKIDGL